MAKVVKSCDFPVEIALQVFEMLNPRVKIVKLYDFHKAIMTEVEPKNLTYPEGWYYAKGNFRNKHTSSNGIYYEVPMIKFDRTSWQDLATYCTLE